MVAHPILRLFVFTIAALGAASGVLAETAGRVQAVVGTARLYDAAGKERELARGTEIRPGDRIVTGDQSLVQLRLEDGGYLSVRTNTDVTLAQYRHDEKAPKESAVLINLARGALRSITGLIGSLSPDRYKVATPTATIGIRGTDHEPVFIPEPPPGETPIAPPGTYDKVNSGATVIRAPSGEIGIAPGQVGFVPAVAVVPPALLPRVPDFFKNLDPAKEKAAARQQAREAVREKGELRPATRGADGDKREPAEPRTGDQTKSAAAIRTLPLLAPVAIDRGPDEGGRTDAPRTEGTLSTRVPLPAPTDRPLLPTAPTAPLIVPTERTISPTTLPPISPTTTSPTTNTTIIRR
ncbi:MAG: FecR family protein [Sterolibacteriaceae bacterium MAG5]|nr:FecR family protein [Candidatus Nitricoxidireducens bremensis]